MTDDIENDLRTLLTRRADGVDEQAITGEGVRRHAATRLVDRTPASVDSPRSRTSVRTSVRAPLAAAAAVLALAAGVTATTLDRHGSTTPPAAPTTGADTTSPQNQDGSVPQCPSTLTIPGNPNTVCAIGTPPSSPAGSVVLRTVHP